MNKHANLRSGTVLGLLGAAVLAVSAGPLDDIKPGQWVELPCKNKIRNVLPSPLPSGNGPETIIDAWNSGAYDTKRDRLLIWGGGHQDYQGNEIYAFDINTLTWSRITNPSSTPVAVHTYDGIEYMPQHDKFFSQGGSTWPTGNGTAATYVFDMSTLQWEKRASHPLGGQLGVVSAYDPATGTLIWDGNSDSNSRLCIYDVAKDSWTFRSNDAVGNYSQTAAFDAKNRRFVRLGGGDIHEYDFNQSGTLEPRVVNASGPNDMVRAANPGVDYDPVSEEIVAWHGGASVYSLNLATKVWTKTTGTGTHPGSAVQQGTFNRWRYVPSKNVFLVLNSIDGNVFAYRHKASAAAPTWYLELLIKGGSGIRMNGLSGTGLGLAMLPAAQGLARFRLTGLAGTEAPTLSILDSRGRTRVVLAGVSVGNGAAEYSWKGGDTAGMLFAEGRVGDRLFRAALPAQP